MSEWTARKNADEEIENLNGRIMYWNAVETWDPEIKYPLFNDEEDWKDRDLIHDVIVRFQTAPKSITKEEFEEIVSSS